MAAPIIRVPVEKNLRDPIDIRMNIIHPEPVVVVAFPAATVMRTFARLGEVIGGIQERLLEMPIQRWEEIEEELLTPKESKDERKARERLEHQLGLIQEELEGLRRSRLP
nr:hypothetical protein [Tanacetum cinerariifolium]